MPRAPRETGVLLLSERADYYGGGQRSLRDLAIGLRESPYRPIAVLPGAGALAASLQEAGIEVAPLPLPTLRGGGGPRLLQTVWALAALARRRGAFVLHSDSPRSAFYAGLASRLSRRAHLWHVRAQAGSPALPDRLLLGVTDRAVAVSAAVAARSAAFRDSDRVRVVPTGINPPAFLDRDAARASLGLPHEGFVAGVIGRVEPDKGGDDAVEALLALRWAAPGAILAFLGPFDERTTFHRSLKERAQAEGLRASVRCLGAREEAAPLLRAFDLVLHPSRHEALPRVLIEALFAGVPAIAGRVGGIPEVIEDGVSGILVAPRDPIALGAAAASLALDGARRAEMGRAATRIAQERFSLTGMVKGLTAVYEELRPERPEAIRREARL
jgi:glycosyltransferase involved in cell wall biosynthesis